MGAPWIGEGSGDRQGPQRVQGSAHLQGIPMYKVRDFNEELIEGDFYENDIQKIDKSEDSLWLIEKIIN